MPHIVTIKESLYWSYANLAMAHKAVSDGVPKYQKIHFIIRAKLYKGLLTGTMSLGSILDDEKLKMKLPQACSYCGAKTSLSVDHLIPKAKGGLDTAENMIWACKTCNSSKNDKDVLDWFNRRNIFPPILLLRRYLKVVIGYCIQNNLMDVDLHCATDLPFTIALVPHKFPQPKELILWTFPQDT